MIYLKLFYQQSVITRLKYLTLSAGIGQSRSVNPHISSFSVQKIIIFQLRSSKHFSSANLDHGVSLRSQDEVKGIFRSKKSNNCILKFLIRKLLSRRQAANENDCFHVKRTHERNRYRIIMLIITITITSSNVIGALAALYFTKSTQLNPPIKELFSIIQ